MLTTARAVIVEGKYDKIKLSSVIDGLIITTEGFGIFSDKEKQKFIKKLGREKGIIIVTDSDAAGFKIRNFLKNLVPEEKTAHAYIPDVYGKERRKETASKEGKLGVEGINSELIREALLKTGLFEADNGINAPSKKIATADLFEKGLTGAENSAEKRRALLISLGLPARLTGKSFLQVLNSYMTYEDFLKFTD